MCRFVSGSTPAVWKKHILAKYGHPTAQAMVDSALYHTSLIEKFDYDQIAISIKSSNVQTMIEAYRLAAQQCDYPLHLGVTEAGTARMGLIKSAVGIGSLLCDGIGDTIRVSLTDDPVMKFMRQGISSNPSVCARRESPLFPVQPAEEPRSI